MTSDDITMASKRKGSRSSLFLSATVTVEGRSTPVTVRVRNLSEGGMMIDGHLHIICDARVVVTVRGIGDVGGRIAWTEAGRAGVAFDEPIDPKLARAPSPAGMSTDATLFKVPPLRDRRPGLRPR